MTFPVNDFLALRVQCVLQVPCPQDSEVVPSGHFGWVKMELAELQLWRRGSMAGCPRYRSELLHCRDWDGWPCLKLDAFTLEAVFLLLCMVFVVNVGRGLVGVLKSRSICQVMSAC